MTTARVSLGPGVHTIRLTAAGGTVTVSDVEAIATDEQTFGARIGLVPSATWIPGNNVSGLFANRFGVSGTAAPTRYTGAWTLSTTQLGITTSEAYEAPPDFYYLPRGARVGLTWAAGPWGWIEWPQGSHGDSVTLGLSSSSAFTASWAKAETIAQSFGYASVSSFAATWTKAQTLAATLGISFDDFYSQIESQTATMAAALGFDSVATFAAAWTSAETLSARLGFSSVSAFLAVWEQAQTIGARFGVSIDSVYAGPTEGVQTIFARFGVSSSFAYSPPQAETVNVRVSLYDRSPRMALVDGAYAARAYDRSPRMTLYDRSDT